MYRTHSIVVVDDNPDYCNLLSYSFRLIGNKADVLFLNSGSELIEYLNTKTSSDQPSLVVLDYNMPVLNGGETLRRMKSNPFTVHIPVLIYSTSVTPVMRKESESLGVLMCMEKAGNLNELFENVKFFSELARTGKDSIAN